MQRVLGGGFGPGLIPEVQDDMKDLRKEMVVLGKDISTIRETVQDARWKLLLFVVLIVFAIFSAGSGTISLKTLLEVFK